MRARHGRTLLAYGMPRLPTVVNLERRTPGGRNQDEPAVRAMARCSVHQVEPFAGVVNCARDVAVTADRAYRPDELASRPLRACTDCLKRKQRVAFLPIRGTPYFYGRCLECRARRKRERYDANPVERAAEIARSMRTRRRKQASKHSAVERPTPERVIEAVAAASRLPPGMLLSPRRSPTWPSRGQPPCTY